MNHPSAQFHELWIADAEYGFIDGQSEQESAWRPVVFCAIGLRSGQRIHFLGHDPSLQKFIESHRSDLFIAHNAVAEMKYLLRLGCELPEYWFDTYVGWRRITNQPKNLAAGLTVALEALGKINSIHVNKKKLQEQLGNLKLDLSKSEVCNEVIDYCYSDCEAAKHVYLALNLKIRADVMLVWCEYLKAISRMELRGIPFNIYMYEYIYKNAPRIRKKLALKINESAGTKIFEFDGERPKFRSSRFLRKCLSHGIRWPLKVSDKKGTPYLSVDDDTLKEMEDRLPLIAEIRQVRKTLKALEKRSLVIDVKKERHYFQTIPFRSVTGRNQPKNFIFSAPKWLRFLIQVNDPEWVLVSIDYDAQEIGIAAALSGDLALQQVYSSADSHMEFAIHAGAAPIGATKKTHPDIRKAYKAVNLGVLYGQTAHGIAARLGVSEPEAQEIIEDHKRLFSIFWKWSEGIVQSSYDRGYISSPNLWSSKIPLGSNERTWMNWPMQATGADIMRLTVIYLDRQNVHLLAPIHDGFLLACRKSEINSLKLAVNYACETACEQALKNFSLKWTISFFENGNFVDEDGQQVWDSLHAILSEENHHE